MHVIWVPAVALLLCAPPLCAQLRPLEPFDWGTFTTAQKMHAHARIGMYHDQRASLAGTAGSLVELGELGLYLRVGTVVLEFAGTPQRWYDEETAFAAPTGGALSDADGKRHDSGDYRVATAVRLTSAQSPTILALRFGTRLPTTDNKVGLDRDQIDFFALLGMQHKREPFSVSLEIGLGINGTRIDTYEQSDVVQYAGGLAWRRASVQTSLMFVGQEDLKQRPIRGNEDLGEARLGLRIGQRRWLEAAFVRGYRNFSPEAGFLIGGGYAFDWR
ncbi:MAG: hypothetical protein WEE89_02565 [Gemmatimonadota bacterium]